MRNKSVLFGLLLYSIGFVAMAESSPPSKRPTSPQGPVAESEKPELTRRSLPTDTLNPSEKVSEDFPVPFPVDI